MGLDRADIQPTADYKLLFFGTGNRVIAQQPVGGTKVNMGSEVRIFFGD